MELKVKQVVLVDVRWREFLRKYRRRFGLHMVTDDPIEAGYIGAKLWARAVEAAGRPDAAAVRDAIAGATMSAPQGFVRMDDANHHLWKYVRVGQITINRQFDEVWSPGSLIPPRPFPASRTRAEWSAFVEGLDTR